MFEGQAIPTYQQHVSIITTRFKVNAVDPGFVATDFNGHWGTGTVQEGGARIARAAMMGADGPTGKFISEEHNPETGDIP